MESSNEVKSVQNPEEPETPEIGELQSFDLKIDYVTRQSQKKMKVDEKCDLIVDYVRNGRILVWEGGFDASTEMKLIKRSMEEIDHEHFLGLEIFSPNAGNSLFHRESRITIITPATCDVRFRTI